MHKPSENIPKKGRIYNKCGAKAADMKLQKKCEKTGDQINGRKIG